MNVSVILSAFASDTAHAIAIFGCIILWIISELTDDTRDPVLARASSYLTVYAVPLLILFVYIVIVWGAGITFD